MTVVKSNYELSPNHYYPTEPWATKTALRFFPITDRDRVWEPCAGNHHVVKVFREEGVPVYSSDIETYRYEHDEILDFLNKPDDYNPFNANVIFTNPPYGAGNRLAAAFCRKALLTKGVDKVAMLLTPKFDFGSTRTDLFRDNPAFYGKLHLLDRISWAENGKTGTDDSAWYFWDKRNTEENPIMFYGGKNR
ncbi:conjugal transfer protein [Sinorhizobium phage phiM7]|uniref:Conjugal transfer protein n=2 Tax=Emdodecavirus TaxID=1980937 RepID=A0A0F6YPR6_9CAUD|nr:DNA methyltransferase [Sinorhizobium phage phiN3]YP_009601325.1 DNA methyltransferase [Sinorhizobium phage phiM7]AKF12745.1 conjugal transfer protein [Sinorhizobium phage phiM7]AKF13105.1 conjugal transfer protein [Sinorhizobium phage phiM19]AKF13475.1 conjugal transfer protein [Sinorhizobium phage phiN3]